MIRQGGMRLSRASFVKTALRVAHRPELAAMAEKAFDEECKKYFCLLLGFENSLVSFLD